MLKIGLTGGIGSGKSTVAKVFETLGIPVYYADSETKRLMNEDPELRSAISHHFGEESYTGNQLNRAHIASIVFNDPGKLALLNSLTHPVTIRHADQWMQQQVSPYVVKEAALLFESGANKHLDKIIGVYSPQHIRVDRVMKRDKVTREEVLKRINQQMNEEEKMKRCDFVLTNDESHLLLPQILQLHQDLIAASATRGKKVI